MPEAYLRSSLILAFQPVGKLSNPPEDFEEPLAD